MPRVRCVNLASGILLCVVVAPPESDALPATASCAQKRCDALQCASPPTRRTRRGAAEGCVYRTNMLVNVANARVSRNQHDR